MVGIGPREHRRMKKTRIYKQFKRSSKTEDLDTDVEVVNSGQISDGDTAQIVSDLRTCDVNEGGDDTARPHSEVDQAEKSEADQAQVNNGPSDDQIADISGSDEDTKGSVVAVVAVVAHPCRSSRRSSTKESLLGHGPHGKQVVDMIIEKEGDEGIRQFCQLWRAVFVDALQPKFLPPGWDVTHSGRREFGEFSVYNPEKQAELQQQES